MKSTEMTLFDASGRRKYLVESEFKAFLAAAETLPRESALIAMRWPTQAGASQRF